MYGVHGDFIMYPKQDDEKCPVRIAQVIYKIDERKNAIGKYQCKSQNGMYARGNSTDWFSTMTDLINFYKKEDAIYFNKQFSLSHNDAQHTSCTRGNYAFDNL